MKISEIFYSIQGEGILIGTPSLFIRTSGCNLRCEWCDTPYASWKPEGEELTVDEILSQAWRCAARHVVITGGEPLIAPDIVRLTELLAHAGLHITIETAGTVCVPVKCDLMSISPKLANSTPRYKEGGRWARQHERFRLQPNVLRTLVSDYEYQLKFVVQNPDDIMEIRDLVEQLQADINRVVLMPEGTDPVLLRQKSLWLVELCKQEGYRFSPRLQIDLYGNRRGF